MRSHSVTCHPAEVTFLPLPQPKLVFDLATPKSCKAELAWDDRDDRGPISLADPGPPNTLRRLWFCMLYLAMSDQPGKMAVCEMVDCYAFAYYK